MECPEKLEKVFNCPDNGAGPVAVDISWGGRSLDRFFLKG